MCQVFIECRTVLAGLYAAKTASVINDATYRRLVQQMGEVEYNIDRLLAQQDEYYNSVLPHATADSISCSTQVGASHHPIIQSTVPSRIKAQSYGSEFVTCTVLVGPPACE
eukprot:2447951-Pleurochrysis_carterae.AAC.3